MESRLHGVLKLRQPHDCWALTKLELQGSWALILLLIQKGDPFAWFTGSCSAYPHCQLGLLGWFCVCVFPRITFTSFLFELYALSQKLLSPAQSPEVHPCHDQNIYPTAMFYLVPHKGPYTPCNNRTASEWIVRSLAYTNKTLINPTTWYSTLSPSQLYLHNSSNTKTTQVQSRPWSNLSHSQGGWLICSVSTSAIKQQVVKFFTALFSLVAGLVWWTCTTCLSLLSLYIMPCLAFYIKPLWKK